MSNILITGAASGLGKALCRALSEEHRIFEFDRNIDPRHDVRGVEKWDIEKILDGRPLDVLINCAGINRIGWLKDFRDQDWDEVMDINAKGIFKMTQACLPHLIASKGTVVNIVSNASHMPMTCSTAYNASKGAAHIMTLQMARELTKQYGITVFGISPNKLQGTGMSHDIDWQVQQTRGWTTEQQKTYQLQSLLCGEETDPFMLADFAAYLLQSKAHHKYLTGCILPYGA